MANVILDQSEFKSKAQARKAESLSSCKIYELRASVGREFKVSREDGTRKELCHRARKK